MKTQLVVLKLNGNLEEQGFQVTLEISGEGQRAHLELRGELPPDPNLVVVLQQWQQDYRSLGNSTRIKPHKISFDRSQIQNFQNCQSSAQQLQIAFNHWFNALSFRDIDQRLREELNHQDPIRVLIRSDNWHLNQLPWHLWNFFDRYTHAEAALSSEVFAKFSSTSYRSIPPQKVRILAILGHSAGIDVEKDCQLLQSLPQAEIEFLVEPKRQEISDHLWEQAWDIIFFAGHSETDGEIGRIYLNPTESLTISELWYAFRKAVENGLQLAIFNSCDGLGLAKQLNDIQIPQMIVMREMVPDQIAHEFLKYFLKAFSSGASLYEAVRVARERLQALESEYPCATWLPVIYQHPALIPPTWQSFLNSESLRAWQAPEKLSRTSVGRFKFQPKLPTLKWCIGGVFLLSIGLWQWGIPLLSKTLHNLAFSHPQNAQNLLETAHTLTPNNRATLYTLGKRCEQVGNYTCAISYYQRAAQFGLVAAYSELARLHITQDANYLLAMYLINQGLELAENDPSQAPIIHHALWKNKGWVQLKLGQYSEAKESLEKALSFDDSRASAYCLLAQVQEQVQPQMAWQNWQHCNQLAQPSRMDENQWQQMARQRLNSRSLRLTQKL